MNWKKALIETLIQFGHDFLLFCNILIVIFFVMGQQSPEQVKAIELFFQEKDWTIMILLMSGVVFFGYILHKIFQLLFLIIKFFIKNDKINN